MRYNYEGETKQRVLDSEIRMIRKAWPFTEGDYVLWVVPDYFDLFEVYRCDADVAIYDENGEPFQLEHDTIVRKPYYNKRIWQVSLKCGSKRTYGIPLVFHSAFELQKIARIKVTWTIYHPISLKRDDSCQLGVDVLVTDHYVSFDASEEGRFFTLSHKDVLFNLDVYSDQVYKEAMDAYQAAVCQSWYVYDMGHDGEWRKEGLQILRLNRYVYGKQRPSEYTEEEVSLLSHGVNIVRALNGGHVSALIKEHGLTKRDKIFCGTYYYKDRVELAGMEYADILAEPGFGFV